MEMKINVEVEFVRKNKEREREREKEHMLVCSNAILTANIVHPHDPIHQYVSSNALVNVILVMVVSSCCLTYWVYSESSTVSLLWHSHLKQQQTSFPDNFLWRRRVGEFKTFSINFFLMTRSEFYDLIDSILHVILILYNIHDWTIS